MVGFGLTERTFSEASFPVKMVSALLRNRYNWDQYLCVMTPPGAVR
jgi:hypothetical protein